MGLGDSGREKRFESVMTLALYIPRAQRSPSRQRDTINKNPHDYLCLLSPICFTCVCLLSLFTLQVCICSTVHDILRAETPGRYVNTSCDARSRAIWALNFG